MTPVDVGLGTALRALIHALDGAVQRVYDAHGVDFRPRFYVVLRHLEEAGEAPVSMLAETAGVSQPAMTQTIAKMLEKGLVAPVRNSDGRRHVVTLSDKGRLLAADIAPVFAATRRAAEKLEAETGVDLSGAIAKTLDALRTDDFAARIERELSYPEGHAR
ncbi:MarR family winged helix-turn-helix transcriptional regulator [Sphingomicrobium arenosum]|uniref:MarR family winged helix-turn-helix transcriptional regulator n=1 Tax=Sphingomicrobium arenosum TaxID=2233861 RepID=UPI00224043F6|nr:MarR family winged helix-turn-helix transcriptional regulator [Sphingomicrobium arenosum]